MIILDADSIVYRVGFPADGKQYLVVGFDAEGDPVDQGHYKYIKDAREFGEAFDDHTIDPITNPDPIAYVLHSTKVQVQKVMNACVNYGPERIIYLSGPGNYRDELATIKKYKGNRSQEAPYHYFNIRHYLGDEWGASVVEGREADDQCSIQAWTCRHVGEPYVVVSIDKDLDMIPGWHYNYVRGTFYHMNDTDATRHFYKQLLSGDATDNIGGCHKEGPASKKLAQIEAMHSEQDMYDFVRSCYVDSLRKPKCPYEGMDIDDVIVENARLLWMQTAPGEMWTPPGQPNLIEESFE